MPNRTLKLVGEKPSSEADAYEQIPMLRALGQEERERILPFSRLRTLEGGASVWEAEQPTEKFTFLVRGRVKMVNRDDRGRETIMHMAEAGELLCTGAVWNYQPFCCSAVTMEGETIVLDVHRRELLDLMERSNTVMRSFVSAAANRGVVLGQRVTELASGQVECRIASLLLRLADGTGLPQENNCSILIPVSLSRQDLADLCATTVESAIRAMSRLGQEGVVSTVAGGFILRDRPALERISQGRGGR